MHNNKGEYYERYYCNWRKENNKGMFKEIKNHMNNIEKIRKEQMINDDKEIDQKTKMTIDRSPAKSNRDNRHNKTIEYCCRNGNRTPPHKINRYKNCSPIIRSRTPNNYNTDRANCIDKKTPSKTPNSFTKIKNKNNSHIRNKTYTYNCDTPVKQKNNHNKIPKAKNKCNKTNTAVNNTSPNNKRTLPSTGKKHKNSYSNSKKNSSRPLSKNEAEITIIPHSNTTTIQDYNNELVFQSFGKPLSSIYPYHNEQDHLLNINNERKRTITSDKNKIKPKTIIKGQMNVTQRNLSAKTMIKKQPKNNKSTIKRNFNHLLPDDIHNIDFNELDQFSPPFATTQLNFNYEQPTLTTTTTQYRNTLNYQKHLYSNRHGNNNNNKSKYTALYQRNIFK